MARETLLVVDDEPNILKTLGDILSDEGYRVETARSAGEGIRKVEEDAPEVVFLDVWLGSDDGLSLLNAIREKSPQTQVIVMSGHGTIETAVRAIKNGAFDYVEKPFSMDKVLITVQNALRQKSLEEENQSLRRMVERNYQIVGESPVIRHLLGAIERAGPTNGWVLIQGENGTGKELVAREIHRLSPRKDCAFVDINCAAIPENLIESELFGYEKGAFTGAMTQKKGKFEVASGGTLFLDEIGDMSLPVQAKVLRVLQEKKFQRVGGNRDVTVDVRVIAASNKNLEDLIRKREFRDDLFYRLNVIPVTVPPLRERPQDIPLLLRHFIHDLVEHEGLKPKQFSEEATRLLCQYSWPGNVRELRNLIERLLIMEAEPVIERSAIERILGNRSSSSSGPEEILSLRDAREGFERDYIQDVLRKCGGNMTRASEVLRVDRTSLYRKLKTAALEDSSAEEGI
ncbi:sigma-54-dependent transcriptional regulator [Leptospirillum ferriphilum]|jgi:two-component system nitrogen regulation response regulator NtrX|uniref:Two component, sigma54 specific, transcriptional regulator, Fis family n=2 Tax=Leptospirillum TaxID=179 RepID=A0A094WE59_9BACT|nr:sigma-54 dependent transcriptional regulator [Leptospirillum ferriphilum]EDZ39789.1 MAG: Putative two component, sigma54 specific, transcriptional regulator, Fis family [Leptospirillum sp. Group II '5-way CG']KGA94820.1 two component, sigma54 specific, transcriptional regulator, Fis family [Leptospirillum ferriphilum]